MRKMHKTKQELDYLAKYEDIPREDTERLLYLLESHNIPSQQRDVFYNELERIKNIKWKHVSFIIYLIPKATPRPRMSFKTGHFYVLGAKENKTIFQEFYDLHKELPFITTPCKFSCTSYLPTPTAMSITEKIFAELGFIRPINKPDWDNLGKTYSDMIQGSLLYDDELIVEGVSRKFYSIKPRIEITLSYMEEMDCKFNQIKQERKDKNHE